MEHYGLIYRETNLHGFPVDPWTTYSHILLLIVLIYWWKKVYGQFRKHAFLTFCLVLISLNFTGSFLYHSLRGPLIWILLDSLPIAILSVAVAVHFLVRIKNLFLTVLIIAFPLVSAFIVSLFSGLPAHDNPDIGYFAMGLIFVLSLMTYLGKSQWKNWQLIAGATGSVIIAISFRVADTRWNFPFLPMGTHWLWHVFSTISGYLLLRYVYLDDLLPKRAR